MTLGNIAAGFRVTGVYPFNRNAIPLPSEEPSKFDPEAKSTGINYIPLYSPAHSRQPKATTVSIHDKYSGRTSAQLISPVKHHEFDPLDYSLTSYGAYTSTPVGLRSPPFDDSHVSFLHDSLSLDNTLERSSSDPSIHKHSQKQFTLMEYRRNCFLPAKKQPCLRDFLHTPRPLSKVPTQRPKSSGRVLTSLENIKIMEEHELKKKEEARLKEERKKAERKRSWRLCVSKMNGRRPGKKRQNRREKMQKEKKKFCVKPQKVS